MALATPQSTVLSDASFVRFWSTQFAYCTRHTSGLLIYEDLKISTKTIFRIGKQPSCLFIAYSIKTSNYRYSILYIFCPWILGKKNIQIATGSCKKNQIATLKWKKSMGQGVFASPDLAAFELGVSPGMEVRIAIAAW